MSEGFVYPPPVTAIVSTLLADADYGDIVVSGVGTVLTIDTKAVTLAKMNDITTDSLIGRDTAGTGVPEVITLGASLSMTGAQVLQRAALTGDVTAAVNSNATTIANDAVTYAKMQNISATDKILGRSSAGAGDAQEIACTAAGRALIDDADAAAQRATLSLGAFATANSVKSRWTDTYKFDRPPIKSVAGTLAASTVSINDATDNNNHYVGVDMADSLETWLHWEFVLPVFADTGQDITAQIGFRESATSFGDIELSLVGQTLGDGDLSNGGAAIAGMAATQFAPSGNAGTYRVIDLGVVVAGGTLSDDDFVTGSLIRDARVTNGNDSFAGDLRVAWIRFSGYLNVDFS